MVSCIQNTHRAALKETKHSPEFSLILYSRMNSLAQVFRFGYSSEDPSIPISVADPSLLKLPFADEDNEELDGSIGEPYYSSIFFEIIDDTTAPHPEENARSLTLLKCTAQLKNSRIVEALYTEISDSGRDLLDNKSPGAQLRKRTGKSSKWVEEEEFIVDDLRSDAVVPTRDLSISSSRVQRHLFPSRQHVVQWPFIYSLAAYVLDNTPALCSNSGEQDHEHLDFDGLLEVLDKNINDEALIQSSSQCCQTL